VVLGGDNEDNDVNFFLAGKHCGSLQTITVEAGCVNKRDVDNSIVEEGL